MKISVIICAYNAEKTISRTIESVLAQTYANFEIVIINDGSTDGTLKVAEKYQNEHPEIIMIKSIPNGGLANARNHGLSLCTGELYINLDADDYLEADTFEKAVEVLSRDPQIDVCFYGYKDFDENGKFFGSYSETKHYLNSPITGMEAFKMRLQRYIWICQGNAIYRLDMIRNQGICNHPGKNQGEDMYFISRCLLAARKVACFRGDNFCCMTRSDSMNHATFNSSFFQTLELLKCLEDDIQRDYPDQAEELLPFLKSEQLNQTMAIIKRMARFFPLKTYLQEAKPLHKLVKEFDNDRVEKVLGYTKKGEYRICSFSLVAYYFVTRCHDLFKKL